MGALMRLAGVKKNIQLSFENVLTALDGLGREPDRREQEALVDALCSMAAGRYVHAAREIFEVSRSLKQRPNGIGPADRPVTKDMMRRGLIHVRIHH